MEKDKQIWIDPKCHAELKIRAAREGITLKELLRRFAEGGSSTTTVTSFGDEVGKSMRERIEAAIKARGISNPIEIRILAKLVEEKLGGR